MSNRGLFITLWFIPYHFYPFFVFFLPFTLSSFYFAFILSVSPFPSCILFLFFSVIPFFFLARFICLSFKLSFSFLFGKFFKHLNILRYMWFVVCFYLSFDPFVCLVIVVILSVFLSVISLLSLLLYPLKLRVLTAADSVGHHWRSCDNKRRHIFVTFFSLFMQILIVE